MDSTEVTNGCQTARPIENRNTAKKCIPSGEKLSNSNVLGKLFKGLTFLKVNKHLIPLKIALFCWFGGAFAVSPFVGLHLKQLGLSVQNLSFIYMISPFCQFAGSTVTGIMADKLGRSKPLLQAHLILAVIVATSMLFIPGLDSTSCEQKEIDCFSKVISYTKTTTFCRVESNSSQAFNCSFHCSFALKDLCFQNYISSCGLVSEYNFSAERFKHEILKECTEDYPIEINATTDLWCQNNKINKCNWTCKENLNGSKELDLCKSEEGQTKLFALSFALLVLFTTFRTCSFRIFDVTSMYMIKTHNSDYGTQRIWSILGLVICSPISGYIITAVSQEQGKQNYAVAFYIFDALTLLNICVVWWLDVRIDPPAKNMLKKTASLLKDVDIITFLAVVLVIGTAWGFETKFSDWYLQDLNAPSSLIGLLNCVNGLVGLPFLLTSKWFVEKLGSSTLLITGLLGHASFCIGYSFLQNPWWSISCEIFSILTYHLLWVAVITHIYEAAPAGLTAVAISTAGGIHFSIGTGSGSLIGGVTMSKYGGRFAYRLVASICLGTAVLYSFYLLFRRRIWKSQLDIEKIEKEKSVACEIPQKFIPHVMW